MGTARSSLTVSPSMNSGGGGGCAWSGGVPGLGGSLLLGVPGSGGCVPGPGSACSWGGACSGGKGEGGGGSIPACTEADPPVNRVTDACENITLPELHCGR